MSKHLVSKDKVSVFPVASNELGAIQIDIHLLESRWSTAHAIWCNIKQVSMSLEVLSFARLEKREGNIVEKLQILPSFAVGTSHYCRCCLHQIFVFVVCFSAHYDALKKVHCLLRAK